MDRFGDYDWMCVSLVCRKRKVIKRVDNDEDRDCVNLTRRSDGNGNGEKKKNQHYLSID